MSLRKKQRSPDASIAINKPSTYLQIFNPLRAAKCDPTSIAFSAVPAFPSASGFYEGLSWDLSRPSRWIRGCQCNRHTFALSHRHWHDLPESWGFGCEEIARGVSGIDATRRTPPTCGVLRGNRASPRKPPLLHIFYPAQKYRGQFPQKGTLHPASTMPKAVNNYQKSRPRRKR